MSSTKTKIISAENWTELAVASKELVVKLEKILNKEPNNRFFLRDIGMPEPRKGIRATDKTIVQ